MSSEYWVEVRLGGYLRKLGRSHKFLVSKGSEAIKAMKLQVDGFAKAMEESESKGIRFAVFNGKHNIKDIDEVDVGKKSIIRILPVYEGSKRAGLFQTLLGVAFLVAGFFTGGATYAVGAALLLGGIAQLLTPQPQGLKTKEDVENRASYAFGGPVNTTAQGNPIGVLYGEREVGGAIISAGILAEDQL